VGRTNKTNIARVDNNLTVSIEKMTDSTPLRIKRIEVEGLFGLYHHLIDLNLEDRVTILHGPNGVGKTVMLQIIEFIFKPYISYIERDAVLFPFKYFYIEFTNGHSISKRAASYFIETSQGSNLTKKEILKLTVHFIREQRLFRCVDTNMISKLAEYARDLQIRVKDMLAIYAQKSQDLDRTLPQRLLNKTTSQILGSEQLKQQLLELESKHRELREIGLLKETATPAFDVEQLNNIDEAKRGMMTLYIEDTQQKLSVLNDFAQRIKLFLNIINHKFKHKQIKIDHEKGFMIEGRYQQELSLDSLSSGEQHEIVLTYDLLFKVVPNSLVLIDEPELSLHLTWQGHFLPDLLEIVKIANFDVIIATHSPFIIGSRRDLMVALEDKVQ
jgi:predicted ATP-binding protein involved in virulence